MENVNASPAQILEAANAAASKAKLDYFLNGGREGMVNCGFAWVEVNPAKGAFIQYCKSVEAGSKHWKKGWMFWGPGSWPSAEQAGVERIYGQDIDVNYAGAAAFAKVLRDYGLDARACQRLD